MQWLGDILGGKKEIDFTCLMPLEMAREEVQNMKNSVVMNLQEITNNTQTLYSAYKQNGYNMTVNNYLKQMNEQLQFDIERGAWTVKQYANRTLEIDSQCIYKEEFVHLQADFNTAYAKVLSQS